MITTLLSKLLGKSKATNNSKEYDDKTHIPVSNSLKSNIEWFKEQFDNSDDLVIREFENCDLPSLKGAILFLDGIVDLDVIQDKILGTLLQDSLLIKTLSEENCPEKKEIQKKMIPVSGISNSENLNTAMEVLLDGDSILFIEGIREAYSFSTKGGEKRQVTESEHERNVRGSRLGFVEDISTNISLVRRRIKTPKVVVKKMHLGTEAKNQIAIIYHRDRVIRPVLEELEKRLNKVTVDRVDGAGTVEQAIEDSPYSIFPQIQATERPDKVSASIMEGRIAIFTDGTPIALLVPAPMAAFYQSTDDYMEKWQYGTVLRWTRYVCAFISSSFPALYIAIISYHPELLPTDLAFSIGFSRLSVPFPAYVEALMMELVLEILQEAGIRLPAPLSQTVSIVGGLVIGQAAVQAGIISPIMVIIISVTAISSYTISSYSLNLATRLLRIPFIIAAVMLGFYGLVLAWLVALIHLCSLKTLNENYLEGFTPITKNSLDILIRAPLKFLVKKPKK